MANTGTATPSSTKSTQKAQVHPQQKPLNDDNINSDQNKNQQKSQEGEKPQQYIEENQQSQAPEQDQKTEIKEKPSEEPKSEITEVNNNVQDQKTEQPVQEEQVQLPPKDEASTSDQIVYGKPSQAEKELFDLINEYRQQSGLNPVPFSVSLTKVAQMHAKDIVENSPDVDGGNMHSWSDKGPWKAVKYTSDHKQAALMWSKPSELTSYKSEGFEISHGYTGNDRKTTMNTPQVALDGWKKSEGHNNVIVEKTIWKDANFQAMGVGMYKGYACCWFGKPKDDAVLEN